MKLDTIDKSLAVDELCEIGIGNSSLQGKQILGRVISRLIGLFNSKIGT